MATNLHSFLCNTPF